MERLHKDDEINDWMSAGYSLDKATELKIVSKLNALDNVTPISVEDLTKALERVEQITNTYNN